jgi:hypothetical protein
MTVETALYSTLAGTSGVSALVSTRIYPGIAPESAAMPYIVYSLVGTDRLATLLGSGDYARKRMQIECVATTYAGSKALASAVVAALQSNGYQQSEYDLYDDVSQRYSCLIDWSFIAA